MEHNPGPTPSGGSVTPWWDRCCGGLVSPAEGKMLICCCPTCTPAPKAFGVCPGVLMRGAREGVYPKSSHAELTVGNVPREVAKHPLALAACREPARSAGSPAERGGGTGAPPALQPRRWSLMIQRSWCKSLPAQRRAAGVRGMGTKVGLAAGKTPCHRWREEDAGRQGLEEGWSARPPLTRLMEG